MTTPLGGSLKGASLIGATVNIASYLATINPSQYSIAGISIAGGTGVISGLIGGKIANPFMFGEMSPGLNSLAVVNKVFTAESFGRDFLGNTAGTFLESWANRGCVK